MCLTEGFRGFSLGVVVGAVTGFYYGVFATWCLLEQLQLQASPLP